MGVTVLDQGRTSTNQPAVAAVPENGNASSRSSSVRSTAPRGTAAYEDGAADRRAWEAWFGGLEGAYQEGAEYWAEQRSGPTPGSCYGPIGQNLGDWTAGCLAAKRILTRSDVRRKSERGYYAGWNSY
jgi:hypothetical protein